MTAALPELTVYTFCAKVYPMSIYLKDEATSKAVRKLAKLRGVTLTQAVHDAVIKELAKETNDQRQSRVLKALGKLQAKVGSLPRVRKPRPADKSFFDDLSGNF
jgi:antitoxin VapB